MRRSIIQSRRKHGSIWEIVYIDFLTNMFVLFLALWVIASKMSGNDQQIYTGHGKDKKLNVDLHEKGFFHSGKSELLSEGKSQLDSALKSYPKYFTGLGPISRTERKAIIIEGHTDSVPMKRKNMDNIKLGFNRAYSVYKYINSKASILEGGDNFRKNVLICTVADNFPLIAPETPETREKNRRIRLIRASLSPDEGKTRKTQKAAKP